MIQRRCARGCPSCAAERYERLSHTGTLKYGLQTPEFVTRSVLAARFRVSASTDRLALSSSQERPGHIAMSHDASILSSGKGSRKDTRPRALRPLSRERSPARGSLAGCRAPIKRAGGTAGEHV